MTRFLAVCLMFFGTTAIAEEITLRCSEKGNTRQQYIRFNDEEETIKQSWRHSDLNLSAEHFVVHWSAKLIIFGWKSTLSLTNTDFMANISALDRVKGRLQTVYVTENQFDQEKADIFVYDCDVFDSEKPKF